MIVTIHQPQYLPWLGYFDKADRADIFVLLDNVQYTKNDWQNRNKIRTSQGAQWLTVPIISNLGQKISDVKIDNTKNWRKAHLNAIKLNYRKAPFYNQYIAQIESLYDQSWTHLVDINIAFIEKIIGWLNIQTKIVRASSYHAAEESTQRLVDLCVHFKADTYLSGADGGKYLAFEKFAERNIEVQTQNYQHPVYSQLWTKAKSEDFLSHMSVLDLLLNCGEQSINEIRGQTPKK